MYIILECRSHPGVMMKKETIGDILIERMKLLACCKNYDELAQLLGIKKSDLAKVRRTGKLYPELREKLMLHGINYLWVEKESGPALFEEPGAYKYH